MATTNNTWQKVLEDRVSELEKKEALYREEISRVVNTFKEWVSTASEIDIYYDAEYKALSVTEIRETYKALWSELNKAKSELAKYKEFMERGSENA